MNKQSFMDYVDEQSHERQKAWDEFVEDNGVKPLVVEAPTQREGKHFDVRPWARAEGVRIAQTGTALMVNNPRNAHTFGGGKVDVKAGKR